MAQIRRKDGQSDPDVVLVIAALVDLEKSGVHDAVRLPRNTQHLLAQRPFLDKVG